MCAYHNKDVQEGQGGKSSGKKTSRKSESSKKTKKETSSKSGKKHRSLKSDMNTEPLNSNGDEKDKVQKNEKTIKAIGPYEQCNICGSLCERTGHIQCAECENFHICLSCFCRGYEKPLPKSNSFVPIEENFNHKNTHKYIPIGVNNMPLFSKDWTAEQELLLLDGLGKYGLGNWKQIAELVNMSSGPPKTSLNCQKHYYEVYINTNTPPLPDLNNIILDGEIKYRRSTSSSAVVEEEEEEKSPTSESPSNKPQTFGYWPLRGDFDVEYDNDAELILADMEFRDDDSPQQKELKLSVIEIYNSKLDERVYRKRIIIERGLLDSKSLQQKERKLTTEERELHNLLRPFSRFHSPDSHDQLVHLLVQERKIRSRLYQLLLWRSLGLESVQDVYDFEHDRITKKRQYEASSRIISSINIKERANKNKTGLKKEGSTPPSTGESLESSPPTEIIETGPAFDTRDRVIAECLDQRDIDFCKAVNIPPIVFYIAKRVLLEEVITNPLISIDEKVKTFDLNVTKHGRLFDFILNLTPQSASKASDSESVVDLDKLPLDSKGNVDSSCISSEISPSK